MRDKWDPQLMEEIKKHLENGGHISEADGYGFSYWNVDKWPLQASKIEHDLREIHKMIIDMYHCLDTVSAITPILPRIEEQDVSIKDFEDPKGCINMESNPYKLVINSLICMIKNNLIIMDRALKNEFID